MEKQQLDDTAFNYACWCRHAKQKKKYRNEVEIKTKKGYGWHSSKSNFTFPLKISQTTTLNNKKFSLPFLICQSAVVPVVIYNPSPQKHIWKHLKHLIIETAWGLLLCSYSCWKKYEDKHHRDDGLCKIVTFLCLPIHYYSSIIISIYYIHCTWF